MPRSTGWTQAHGVLCVGEGAECRNTTATPDLLKIMPALVPIVGRTQAEAQAKLEQLQSLIDRWPGWRGCMG